MPVTRSVSRGSSGSGRMRNSFGRLAIAAMLAQIGLTA
jgi:hypothetical protein